MREEPSTPPDWLCAHGGASPLNGRGSARLGCGGQERLLGSSATGARADLQSRPPAAGLGAAASRLSCSLAPVRLAVLAVVRPYRSVDLLSLPPAIINSET